jgi:hypothetical protein
MCATSQSHYLSFKHIHAVHGVVKMTEIYQGVLTPLPASG